MFSLRTMLIATALGLTALTAAGCHHHGGRYDDDDHRHGRYEHRRHRDYDRYDGYRHDHRHYDDRYERRGGRW